MIAEEKGCDTPALLLSATRDQSPPGPLVEGELGREGGEARDSGDWYPASSAGSDFSSGTALGASTLA
jgi:hypothetical protein